MDDRPKEPIDPIVDGFTRTLLPIFSWLVSRYFSATFGYKLTVVLLHPTMRYRDQVAHTWVENNQLFSCAEILNFQTASGRRRGRKKLRRELRPFLREMESSKEFFLFKRHFQEKWDMLNKTVDNKIPTIIPHKTRIEIDLTKLDIRNDEQLITYGQEAILEAWPEGSTLADENLRKRVVSEVDNYPETIRSLLWEASQYWNLLRQVGIRKNSEIWKILGFDPNNEPHLEELIDWALDFGLGEVNEDKLMYLSRWFMDRILVSQFIIYPYSEKRFYSLEKPIANGLTRGDTLASKGEENELPLSDEDRLLQFCELAGIEIDILTAGDSSRMLDILRRLDGGNDFSSKKGISMQACYGARANSEKTQRQRLFKKLREARNKTK